MKIELSYYSCRNSEIEIERCQWFVLYIAILMAYCGREQNPAGDPVVVKMSRNAAVCILQEY